MKSLLTKLAVEVIPAWALRAIFGVGLKEATNWSLRAASKRTTLLLVWDEEDKNEIPVSPKYRGNRGRKRWKRETELTQHQTPTTKYQRGKKPPLHLKMRTLYNGVR
ncbi:hypothetical protein ACJMK2_017934 [Sinanodonta woodiana]|uniref:Uncharacterized protein n=1 Tax=Sinanodonta woodiana TaxID=1069815 RepID=A0ABD3UBV4_SINWO